MAVLDAGGYVLAGGKSSRMGRDKSLLELAGKPLIAHAVAKLRRICTDVHILGGNPALDEFAPLVPDLHPGCGPLGGLEAALEHSSHDWNLFLPVDVPFVPSSFLEDWVRTVVFDAAPHARIAMFTVEEVPQPLLCLLHRDVAPFIRAAMERGSFRIFPMLEGAGQELATRQNVTVERTFLNSVWEEQAEAYADVRHEESRPATADAQQSAKHLWFTNLNTPEEFAQAEQHADALDT
jgi:molybdopterin-guanine dinucleotide biosynthesis protein A